MRVDRIVTGEEGGLLTALGSITAEVSIVIDGPFHAAQISRMLEHGRRGRVGHIGAAIAGPTGTLLAAAARSDDSVKGLINQLEMSTALDVLDHGSNGRERVVVVADRAPTLGLDPQSCRVTDIILRLSSIPTIAVTLLLTGDAGAYVEEWKRLGINVVGPLFDPLRSGPGMDSNIGLVILCGAGGASRALRHLGPNSIATVVVDAVALSVVQQPGIPADSLAPNERAGAATLQAHRRRRDRDLIKRADQVWCRSEAEAERIRCLGVSQSVRQVSPRWSMAASAQRESCRGVVGLLAGVHREYGEIDIETTIDFVDRWPQIRSIHPDAVLQIELDRPFRFDCLDGVEGVATVAFGESAPDLWVMPRAYGSTDWAALRRVVSSGAPVLATPNAVADVDDPASLGITVVDPSTMVHEVVKGLDIALSTPSERRLSRDDFDEVMLEFGHVVPEQDIETLPSFLDGRRGRNLDRERYLRGRIDTPTPEDQPAPPRPPLQLERPLISILVPVYDPPLDALASAIDSVLQQSYERWELFLVDDAGLDESVRTLLRDYEERDVRIRVFEREHNGGIAEASATALAMAKGEFVALLDHDDELDASALEEVARLLEQHPRTDFIYSDEDKISVDGRSLASVPQTRLVARSAPRIQLRLPFRGLSSKRSYRCRRFPRRVRRRSRLTTCRYALRS